MLNVGNAPDAWNALGALAPRLEFGHCNSIRTRALFPIAPASNGNRTGIRSPRLLTPGQPKPALQQAFPVFHKYEANSRLVTARAIFLLTALYKPNKIRPHE